MMMMNSFNKQMKNCIRFSNNKSTVLRINRHGRYLSTVSTTTIVTNNTNTAAAVNNIPHTHSQSQYNNNNNHHQSSIPISTPFISSTTVPIQSPSININSLSNNNNNIPIGASIDPSEVAKFSSMSADWWNPIGKFRPLHSMNPIRVEYIRDHTLRHRLSSSPYSTAESLYKPFNGLTFADIGCGGGLLSESLVRLGGTVTGIDASLSNIKVAQLHARSTDKLLSTAIDNGQLTYSCITAEQLQSAGLMFDIVCAMELIEHVSNPEQFMNILSNLVKPGGTLFISTINRTQLSWLTAIIGAEYILALTPIGTHDWNKFIKPSELQQYIEKSKFIPVQSQSQQLQSNNTDIPLNMLVDDISGLFYNPINGKWSQAHDNTQVNYIVCAKRPF